MATSEVSQLEMLAFQAYLTWPWQVAGNVLGLAGLTLVLRGGVRAGVGAAVLLALLWLGMGALAAITAARQGHLLGAIAAALLVTQGLLFVAHAPRSQLGFGWRASPVPWVGIAFAGYALFGHALVAWTLRRFGVDAAISGLTPAWLVVYTIGVLLVARPPASAVVLPVPIVLGLAGAWCLATEPLAQIGLLLGGAVGAWLLWRRRAGPSDGLPAPRGASPQERGWSLDLREADEP